MRQIFDGGFIAEDATLEQAISVADKFEIIGIQSKTFFRLFDSVLMVKNAIDYAKIESLISELSGLDNDCNILAEIGEIVVKAKQSVHTDI